MKEGLLLSRRRMNVDLATLVGVILYGGSTAEEIDDYIRTGRLVTAGEHADSESMPYDSEAMREAVRNANGQLGILRE